jgi:hypothetical protein
MDAVLFASLLWQVIDFLREVANFQSQRSAVITQVTAWVGGIVLVALAAHAKVAADLVLPGTGIALGSLDLGSTILVGLMVSSLGSSLVDVKQAIDRSDSAAKPPLMNPAPPNPG